VSLKPSPIAFVVVLVAVDPGLFPGNEESTAIAEGGEAL